MNVRERNQLLEDFNEDACDAGFLVNSPAWANAVDYSQPWPFPRVSASPGLDSNNCIGTIAPMASSTAIWLADMRDIGHPLAL